MIDKQQYPKKFYKIRGNHILWEMNMYEFSKESNMACNVLSLNKCVNSIFSRRSLSFANQLQLKIPLVELSNHYVFHRIWDVTVKSIIEFLQLIHGFLTNEDKVSSSVYIFPVFWIEVCLLGRMISALCFNLSTESSREGSTLVYL